MADVCCPTSDRAEKDKKKPPNCLENQIYAEFRLKREVVCLKHRRQITIVDGGQVKLKSNL